MKNIMGGIRTLSLPCILFQKCLSTSLLHHLYFIQSTGFIILFPQSGTSTLTTLVFLHTKLGLLSKSEIIERPVIIQKSSPAGKLMVLTAGLPFFSTSSFQHLLDAANLTPSRVVREEKPTTGRGGLPIHKGCAIMSFPVVIEWTRGYRILFGVAKQGVN